jgi:hypothetical protein
MADQQEAGNCSAIVPLSHVGRIVPDVREGGRENIVCFPGTTGVIVRTKTNAE